MYGSFRNPVLWPGDKMSVCITANGLASWGSPYDRCEELVCRGTTAWQRTPREPIPQCKRLMLLVKGGERKRRHCALNFQRDVRAFQKGFLWHKEAGVHGTVFMQRQQLFRIARCPADAVTKNVQEDATGTSKRDAHASSLA